MVRVGKYLVMEVLVNSEKEVGGFVGSSSVDKPSISFLLFIDVGIGTYPCFFVKKKYGDGKEMLQIHIIFLKTSAVSCFSVPYIY